MAAAARPVQAAWPIRTTWLARSASRPAGRKQRSMQPSHACLLHASRWRPTSAGATISRAPRRDSHSTTASLLEARKGGASVNSGTEMYVKCPLRLVSCACGRGLQGEGGPRRCKDGLPRDGWRLRGPEAQSGAAYRGGRCSPPPPSCSRRARPPSRRAGSWRAPSPCGRGAASEACVRGALRPSAQPGVREGDRDRPRGGGDDEAGATMRGR
jgi:hypothetical protein